MKYIIPILALIIVMAFTGNHTGNNIKPIYRDTVPSGVPQLFGGKYYKFNGYVLTDSFIMNAPGDTNNIPYYPSLKFKASDNRWYGWDRSRWNRFLWSLDTLTLLATQYDLSLVNNGLTRNVDTTQLGGALVKNTIINTGSSYHLQTTGSLDLASATGVLMAENSGTGNGMYSTATTGSAIKGASTSGNAVFGIATSGVGGQFNTTNGFAAIQGYNSGGIAANLTTEPSTTNSTATVLNLNRGTTGTAANNIAGSIDFRLTTNTTPYQLSNRIISKLTDATNATYASQLEFWGATNAVVARKAALGSTGQWTWDGYPSLTPQTDTTSIKPIGYNTTTGLVQPMANWMGGGGLGNYTAGNGIDLSNNKISQLFVPLTNGSIVIGNSFAKGCCPDGTYVPFQDTLSAAFLNNVSMVNLGISGIGVRKGAYQLFTNFGESHPNAPVLFEVGFNNTRILTDTATHNATIQAAYKSMILSQFLIHIEAANWGASGVNPNITFSNSSAPASSEDTLLNWQSRLYWFRHNTINTGANWFNKAFCNNDTITIRNFRGPNIGFGTFAYYNNIGSRIKINVDGVDVLTYNPNNKTYTGQAEGFTPDGIIPDAFTVMGLTDSLHVVKVIFIDNGKRGALDYFGTLCSAAESYDRPAFILAFPHMNAVGYAYPGGETTQGILDSASSALRGALRATFPNYAMSFVDINANGFYNPLDTSQIDQGDGIHPTSAGHYQIARAIYSTMIKSDKGSSSALTLDQVLANGNTSARRLLLTGSNGSNSNMEVGSDIALQVAAPSVSWIGSNMKYNGSNNVYLHNGTATQWYLNNNGYMQWLNAGSGSTGGTATLNTRFSIRPSGNIDIGGSITNSSTGAGSALQIDASTLNITSPSVAAIGPTAYSLAYPIRLYAIGQQPGIAIQNGNGGTNEKIWDITAGTTTFSMRMGNDAYSAATEWLTATRSGYTSANVNFAAGAVRIKDSLKIDNIPIGNSSDSVLVKRNNVVYAVAQNNGTWTPTLTADANVDGTPTSLHATYTRIGNIVTCYVTVSVDPTIIATQTEVGITLPVASNFTDSNDLSGAGAGSTGNGQATFVLANANTASDRATLIFQSGSTSASIVTLTFQYSVL